MYMCIRFIILYNLIIAGTSQLNKHMLSSLQQTYFHCISKDVSYFFNAVCSCYHIASSPFLFAIYFANCCIDMGLLCHMHMVCTKDCHIFFVQQFVIAINIKTYQRSIYLAIYHINLYLIYLPCILLYILHSQSKHTSSI